MIFQSLMGLGKSRCDIASGQPRMFLPIHMNIYIIYNTHEYIYNDMQLQWQTTHG
jgi:hypothetical protein